MGVLDAIQTGLSELMSHKLRSMLTMLGVIFGVAAVIAMVSIGEGAKQEALEQIRRMGIDVVKIRRAAVSGDLVKKSQELSPFGLKYSDAEGISNVCQFARRVVPVREVFTEVKIGERSVSVKLVGTTPDYQAVSRSELEYGRYLTDTDLEDDSYVCILGAAAKRDIFGFDNPVGKTLKINRRIFRVVGVMKKKEIGAQTAFSAMRDYNSDIYIPITMSIQHFKIDSVESVPTDLMAAEMMFRKLLRRQSEGDSPLSEIIVQVQDDDATIQTAAVVRSVLERRHRNIRDYEITIPAELLRQSQATQRIFNIVMAAIAGISLLVGGIGIMNIMLATVSQRTREIGVRRCVGATRWDIIRQFMLEALVITCFGGLIGVALGVAGAKGISVYADWRTVVSTQAIVVSFGVSALVGIVFGMYPAIRAAMVDPIEALRSS